MPTEIRNTPTQQAFERLDRDLDLAAVFRAGQQQPADQRAESHGQTGGRSSQAGGDHHQQARRHEQFRAAGARHAAEQRAQHQAAEGNDRRDRQQRLADGEAEAGRAAGVAGRGRARRERTAPAPRPDPGTAGWRSWCGPWPC